MSQKIAVLTGAAGGLGPAIAERLAADFDALVLTDLSQDRLAPVAAAVEALGQARVIAMPCDVSEEDQVDRVIEAAAREGELSGLVNAAGIGIYTPLLEIEAEHWDRMFAINTRGTFLMSQRFIRLATPPASIVNISSIGARGGNEMLAHYGASKAAVIEFSHSVARACARSGIRSNTVMPGIIYTDMWRNTIAYLKEHDPALAEVPEAEIFAGIVEQTIPMGRAQEPQDIAEAVAFFLSDRAKNITGQTIAVDGGVVLT